MPSVKQIKDQKFVFDAYVTLAEYCLAELLLKTGRVREAQEKGEKSLKIRLSAFGENHVTVKQSRLLLENIMKSLIFAV